MYHVPIYYIPCIQYIQFKRFYIILLLYSSVKNKNFVSIALNKKNTGINALNSNGGFTVGIITTLIKYLIREYSSS